MVRQKSYSSFHFGRPQYTVETLHATSLQGFCYGDVVHQFENRYKYLKEQRPGKRLVIFRDGASYHNSQDFRELLKLINQEKPE